MGREVMHKDLLELFDTNYSIYFKLIDTNFIYVHREGNRWISGSNKYQTIPPYSKYVSFEYVLDSVDEETQIKLLFHLDFFLGEVK